MPAAVVKLSLSERSGVQAVYTPLHGVGESSLFRVLGEAGFSRSEIFRAAAGARRQFHQRPPALANSRIDQCLRAGHRTCEETSADLVLASDPDADRLGVSVRGGTVRSST